MATGTVTSLGLGSDIDLQGLLDTQKEADETIAGLALDEIEELQAREEALSSVQSKLLTMKSSALNLSLSSTYLYRKVTSSNDDVATATVLDGTGTGTHKVVTSRLASSSSYISDGFESESATVYVPTVRQSTDSYSTLNDTVLEEGQTLTVNYGNKDDPLSLTITGTAGGMSVQNVLDAINTDATMSPYVTASTYEDEDGIHIQIESTTGETGEDGRVQVTGSDDVTSFTAPAETLSFTVGDGEVFTISVPGETRLDGLAKRINEADDNPGVTAKVIYTGTGDTPYQLILEANDSGEDNRITIISQPDSLGFTESNGKGYTMTGDDAISFATPVTIDNTNNAIVFEEVNEDEETVSLTAEIAAGDYETAEELANAVEKALENVSKEQGNNTDYQVSIDSETGLMSISEAGTLNSVTIDWENASSTAASTLGFTENKTITPMDSSLNAMLTVDGNTYQRQDNTGINNIIEGINLKLYSTGTSTITIDNDTEDIETEIKAIVEAYNTLMTEIDENDDYDEAEESWGSLAQSSTIRTLKQTLQDLITSTVDTNGSITSLLDLGIEIKDDGTLTLDEDALNKILSNNYDEVVSLLKGTDNVEGLGDRLNDSFGSYALSGGYLQDEIDTLGDRVDRLGKDYKENMVRIEKKYELMATEYTKLDSYLSELANIGNYIDSMMSTNKSKK
ncbi:flagellar filament capping protein FliD [Desulfobacter vibrioformis]|uniref:flagellar filament capping protein FliD n=1 Tax=Desulfobacter vibrioformis TaxID=34031 RepID=UPI000551AC5E|nr:flagellar filament capping protein FliD [Desulfobacter vibrioformis]